MAKLSRNLVVNATINKRSLNATAEIANSASGLREVFHDDSMLGKGTANDPLRINLSIIPNVEELNSKIQAIQDLIPLTASLENPLADQGFVNSSIQTATAYFRGDWATWADVPTDPELYPVDATGNHTPTTNDYMVVIADEQTNGGTWRYKYTGLWSEQGKDGWHAEYQVNETPLTAAQLAALNSGVTAQAVSDIATNKAAVANLQTSKQNKLTAGTGITIEGDTISADGGGASLPDQTGNAGKFLMTNGGEVSWGEAFVNKATGYGSLQILGNPNIQVSQAFSVAIGYNSLVQNRYCTALGYAARAKAYYAVQIGNGDNTDANTFKVANANGNFEVMDANGNVPLERLTYVTDQIGDISTALTAILGE